MEIELTNLHTEETKRGFFFDGELWVDKQQAGFVTYTTEASLTIRPASEASQALIDRADQYARTLPSFELPGENGQSEKIMMNLENLIFKKAASKYSERFIDKFRHRSTKARDRKKGRRR